MKLVLTTLVLSLTMGFQAMASELDPVAEMPEGVIVRIAEDGKREVFKANLTNGIVDNATAAAEELAVSLREENKVESLTPSGELDQVTSDESWSWFWNAVSAVSGYYSYRYNCRGGYSDYYPSYSYYNGGYQYNYYYSSRSCGYRSGYNYSDSYGYHYSRGRGWRR